MSRRWCCPRMTRMTKANSQPAHDMTEVTGHPNNAMNEPLSSKAVAAMAAARTPRRIPGPGIHTGSATTSVMSTCAVKS